MKGYDAPCSLRQPVHSATHRACLRYAAIFAVLLSDFCFADDKAISRNITSDDLNEPCASKYLEIHMEASTDQQVGTAIMKLFWLVDPEFLKAAAAATGDPQKWGISLGENFRYYCERAGISVEVAVRQTMLAMNEHE